MFRLQSQRARARAMEAAGRVLDRPSLSLRDYESVGTGAYPPRVNLAIVGGGAVAAGVGLFAATGAIVTGGFLPYLLLWMAYVGLNRPRGLLLTDEGLTLFKASVWTGRPSTLVSGPLPASVLDRPLAERGGSVRITVGDDEAWIRPDTLDRFRSGVTEAR